MSGEAPGGLADPVARLARLERLHEPHVAPLTALVDELRASGREAVPYADPADGGVGARRLFVLQSPTPRALATGFVSRDNPTGTAGNLRRLMAEAGIPRADTLLWNVVPWVLAGPPRLADLRAGALWLDRLLRLLPDLRAIVLLGLDAQRGARFVDPPPGVRVIASYHPSPNTLAGYPHYRRRIAEAFRSARRPGPGAPDGSLSMGVDGASGAPVGQNSSYSTSMTRVASVLVSE